MKKFNKFAAAGLLSVVSAVALVGGTVHADASNGMCEAFDSTGQITSDVSVRSAAGNFVISNGQASTNVTVSGPFGCQRTVTFVAWQASDGTFQTPIVGQSQFVHVTETLGVGTTTLSIPIPNCFFQIDILNGANTTAPDGTPNYVWGQLLGWVQGGSACVQPTANTMTPTSTTTTPTASTTAKAKPVKSQPTTLVNTGPGSTLALFGLTSAAGFIGHKLYRRRLARQQ